MGGGGGGEEKGNTRQLQSEISPQDTGYDPTGTGHQRGKGETSTQKTKEAETERSGQSNKNNSIEAKSVRLEGIKRSEERNVRENKRREEERCPHPSREYWKGDRGKRTIEVNKDGRIYFE